MSSTVGYGIELIKCDGDTAWEIEKSNPELKIVTSRAVYGDEERTFLMLRNTITTAGDDNNTAASLVFPEIKTDKLNDFIRTYEEQHTNPGWYLVDYYVYD